MLRTSQGHPRHGQPWATLEWCGYGLADTTLREQEGNNKRHPGNSTGLPEINIENEHGKVHKHKLHQTRMHKERQKLDSA